MEEKYRKIKKIVEKELSCSAHDMDHVARVYNLCLHLAEGEKIDLDVLKSSALLHDIARVKEDKDHSGSTDHAVLSAEMAGQILDELGFPGEKIKHIQDCILTHRYRTGNKPQTKEAQILFDADKLDTLGAIGVARSFVWVGRNNAKIYEKHNLNEYITDNLCGKINGRIQNKKKHCPQIEYETKIKFVKDSLYTKKAKEIAEERTEFYRAFLKRLEKEINGEL